MSELDKAMEELAARLKAIAASSKGDDDDGVMPFYCGTQLMDWEASNCERCTKGKGFDHEAGSYPCELRQIIFEAECGDGSMTAEDAMRIGFADREAYIWMCNGYEATEEWKAEMALSATDGQQSDLSATGREGGER